VFHTHTHTLHVYNLCKVALVCLITLINTGCDSNKDTAVQVKVSSVHPTLQNGRLAFKTKEDFATFGKDILDQKADLQKSLPTGYIPLIEAFDTDTPSEQLKSLYEMPMSNFMKTFLNGEGEVQIGNSIFKITKGKVYEVAVQNASALEHPETLVASKTSAFISIRDVKVITSVLGSCPGGDGTFTRLIGYSYNGAYGFYAEMGIKTRYEQKDRKVLWWKEWDVSPTNVSQSYSGSYKLPDGIFGWITVPVSGSVSNTSGDLNNIIWNDYVGTTSQEIYVSVNHSGHGYTCNSN
jgi:hypothetical protein